MREALAYIRELAPPEREAILAKVKPATLQTIDGCAPNEWVPVTNMSDLLEALVSEFPDDRVAEQHVVGAGERMAKVATGTFLRLVMKMLTPGLLVRRLPDFWRHDARGGSNFVVYDLSDDVVTGAVEHAEASHIGAVSAGFVSLILKSMGMKNVEARSEDFSRTDPAIDTQRFRVTWNAK